MSNTTHNGDYAGRMAYAINHYVSTRYEEEGEGCVTKLKSGGYAFVHKIGDDVSDWIINLESEEDSFPLTWETDEEFDQLIYDIEEEEGRYHVETNDWLFDRQTIWMYDHLERTPFPPYHPVVWEGTRSRYYQLVHLAEGVNPELEKSMEAVMDAKEEGYTCEDWDEAKEKLLEQLTREEELTHEERRFIDIYSEQMEVDATFYYHIGCQENPDEELGWEQ